MSLVADIHAHPSLKSYLLGKRLHEAHRAGAGMSPFGMCVDLPSLIEGRVNVVLSSVYVPERRLKECWAIRGISLLVGPLRRALRDPAAETANRMLTHLERQIDEGNRRLGNVARVARSRAELATALAEGKIAFLHGIEGGHVLDGDLGALDGFFERGICTLTLAHFFDCGVSPPVDGMPKDVVIRKLGCFRGEPDLHRTLSPFGERVVERMVELGMLVDLTHSTPPARDRVREVVGTRRPLLMTHVGLWPNPMNPTPDEVRAIADGGGVIGVIFMNYWLVGRHGRNGIGHVVDTVEGLIRQGGEDCVALGSDFDGFTDPPDDLREPSDLPRLEDALRRRLTGRQVEKCLGANFLRVLRSGWGR